MKCTSRLAGWIIQTRDFNVKNHLEEKSQIWWMADSIHCSSEVKNYKTFFEEVSGAEVIVPEKVSFLIFYISTNKTS